jgi:hypothetical protein
MDLFNHQRPNQKKPAREIIKARKHEWPSDYREQFWYRYPRKIAKIAAMKALERVYKSDDVAWERLIEKVMEYAAWLDCSERWRPEPKHAATWLNGGCWDDHLPTGRPLRGGNGFAAINRALAEALE